MSITHRTLTPGTVLAARYKRTAYTCTVEQADDGPLTFVLADGRRFRSPSAAGSAVMGGIACNGWRFWSLAEGSASAQAAAAPEPPARTGRPRKLLTRTPNQQGVPEAQVKWFCSACMAGFLVPTGETPTACPAGHSTAPALAPAE